MNDINTATLNTPLLTSTLSAFQSDPVSKIVERGSNSHSFSDYQFDLGLDEVFEPDLDITGEIKDETEDDYIASHLNLSYNDYLGKRIDEESVIIAASKLNTSHKSLNDYEGVKASVTRFDKKNLQLYESLNLYCSSVHAPAPYFPKVLECIYTDEIKDYVTEYDDSKTPALYNFRPVALKEAQSFFKASLDDYNQQSFERYVEDYIYHTYLNGIQDLNITDGTHDGYYYIDKSSPSQQATDNSTDDFIRGIEISDRVTGDQRYLVKPLNIAHCMMDQVIAEIVATWKFSPTNIKIADPEDSIIGNWEEVEEVNIVLTGVLNVKKSQEYKERFGCEENQSEDES